MRKEHPSAALRMQVEQKGDRVGRSLLLLSRSFANFFESSQTRKREAALLSFISGLMLHSKGGRRLCASSQALNFGFSSSRPTFRASYHVAHREAESRHLILKTRSSATISCFLRTQTSARSPPPQTRTYHGSSTAQQPQDDEKSQKIILSSLIQSLQNREVIAVVGAGVSAAVTRVNYIKMRLSFCDISPLNEECRGINMGRITAQSFGVLP